MQKLLRSFKIPKVTHEQTINLTFNFLFFLCSTSFLILYHNYFINPELNREMGKLFAKRRSLLFYQPCDMVKFKIVTFCSVCFQIVGSLLDLRARDVSSAITKILFAGLLMVCYINGYENYSVVLSINLGLFNMFSELLSLLALHSDKDQILMFRVFAGFKIASWIYIFLNFLPFQYLIPTVNAKNINYGLISSFLCWYATNIWTSPLLQIFYHQQYHLTINDCPGEDSLTRCLMLKNSPELKHHNNLKRACLEVKLHHQRHQLNKLNLSESAASAKTFQTIKCVMTLKRKLKRIRSSKLESQQN